MVEKFSDEYGGMVLSFGGFDLLDIRMEDVIFVVIFLKYVIIIVIYI